ncbi:MAG: hypothetical protein U9Q29_02825 [Campylobacterota bacterium]|nr:hypothetical protein [Campylobacterota bacterium]
MFDVTDAFDGFEETVVLKRQSPGDYDENGNWMDGAITRTNILGVVQSLNSDELLILPQGDKTKETVKIHTKTVLKSANEFTKTKADNIEYQGSVWNVSAVNNRNTIGNYYKAILVRL